MSKCINTFLTSIGAKLTEDYHCEFNQQHSSEHNENNIISPLTYYGLLGINGPDTAKFLQGQTTCNINDISEQFSVAGAYCTAKGRMVSSFRIARTNEQTYLLRMRREIVANTQTVFSKYIVFSKAKQHDASDEYVIVGIQGARARAAIINTFGSNPTDQHGAIVADGNTVIQLDKEGLRYECWIQLTELDHIWQTLSTGLLPVNSSLWALENIKQGLGEVTNKTVDAFIPQMLNYQLTGEVNFKKGCYTGQEIVARMQYRGKLKRQMYHIEINCPAPVANTDLHKTGASQSIGNIVNAISTSDSRCEALAVITIEAAENNTVVIGEEQTPVKILSLPYAINSKAD